MNDINHAAPPGRSGGHLNRRDHPMRALFALLITGAVALTAGIVGFQAGVASNIAAAGGVVWLGGGFPGLGFLFFLMFVAFIVIAFGGMRRRAWRHGAMGPMGGPGAWGAPFGPMGGPRADARGEWVAEMHRRLHEADAARAAGTTGTAGTTAPAGPDAADRPTAG
jgi:hypothetical protein